VRAGRHVAGCRLNEIRVLKIKLADLKRELHVLRTGVANVDVLKREVRGLAAKPFCLRQCSYRLGVFVRTCSAGLVRMAADRPASSTRAGNLHWQLPLVLRYLLLPGCLPKRVAYMTRAEHLCHAMPPATPLLLPCQVASLGRQLLQERTKVRALGEELENPLNVHRCVGGTAEGHCSSGDLPYILACICWGQLIISDKARHSALCGSAALPWVQCEDQ
jgi:hypothetical protein